MRWQSVDPCRREHQYRHAAPLAKAAADLGAVHAGEQHVEQDDVRRPVGEEAETLEAIWGHVDIEALPPEPRGQGLAIGLLVFDHQDSDALADGVHRQYGPPVATLGKRGEQETARRLPRSDRTVNVVGRLPGLVPPAQVSDPRARPKAAAPRPAPRLTTMLTAEGAHSRLSSKCTVSKVKVEKVV